MATVPTADALGLGRRVVTEADSTPVDGPSAQLAAAAGNIHADQLKQGSDAVAAIAAPINEAMGNIKRREDTIDRARKTREWTESATKIVQAAKDGSDLSLAEQQTKLNTDLAAERDRILGTHMGGGNSRASLEADFESSFGTYAAQGAAEGVRIQKAIVTEMLSENLAPITAQALKEPGKIPEYFAMWDKHVAKMADGMDSVDRRKSFNHARAGREAATLRHQLDPVRPDCSEQDQQRWQHQGVNS